MKEKSQKRVAVHFQVTLLHYEYICKKLSRWSFVLESISVFQFQFFFSFVKSREMLGYDI